MTHGSSGSRSHAKMTLESPLLHGPDFDFRRSPLCKDSRAQLANTYEHVRRTGRIPEQKSRLLDRIITHAFDRRRGLYLPVSEKVDTFRKFNREISSQLAAGDTTPLQFPSPASYFTNALLIPEGFGNDDFDLGRASAPIHRATNCGLLIVTLEVDCKSREEFEQNLAWTRGKDEDFRNAPFAQVDRDLCLFEDYRGHCIVFTGNRSLHFHLLFSIEHLLNCPADALADARWSQNRIQQAALICKAHGVYWDRSAEMFRERLGSDILFDETLRTFTQWRRTPWAMRVLEKDSEILSLSEGTEVP